MQSACGSDLFGGPLPVSFGPPHFFNVTDFKYISFYLMFTWVFTLASAWGDISSKRLLIVIEVCNVIVVLLLAMPSVTHIIYSSVRFAFPFCFPPRTTSVSTLTLN